MKEPMHCPPTKKSGDIRKDTAPNHEEKLADKGNNDTVFSDEEFSPISNKVNRDGNDSPVMVSNPSKKVSEDVVGQDCGKNPTVNLSDDDELNMHDSPIPSPKVYHDHGPPSSRNRITNSPIISLGTSKSLNLIKSPSKTPNPTLILSPPNTPNKNPHYLTHQPIIQLTPIINSHLPSLHCPL